MKKNSENSSKKIINKTKENNKFQHSKSTQNLQSKFRNKFNEPNLLLVSNPSASKTITSRDLNDNLVKMKISDLSSPKSDPNMQKLEENLVNSIENHTDHAKYKQIIAYNEFLKDENFNLRMTVEKQKIKISSLEERIVSGNISLGENEKLKEKVASLLKENNELKGKGQEKLASLLSFCKKYIMKMKETMVLFIKHESSVQNRSESKDLILKEITNLNENFYKAIFSGKYGENLTSNVKKEDKKENIDTFEENFSSNYQYVEVVAKLEKQLNSLKGENENLNKQLKSYNKKPEDINYNKASQQENNELKKTIRSQENELKTFQETVSKLHLELSSKNSLIDHLDNILKTSLVSSTNNSNKPKIEESCTNLSYSISKCNNDYNSNTLLFSNQNIMSPMRQFIDESKKEIEVSEGGKVSKMDLEVSFAEKYLKENDLTNSKLQVSSSSGLQKSSFLKQEIDTLDIEIKQLQNKFKHMLKNKK